MDPETQRFFVMSLVGLLLFFPVFNQVADTALEALRDADHKAQLDDFFKKWDDVPEDRKLEYWDGRNPPPEAWKDGEPPDDFRYGGGGGNNGGGGGSDENETEEEEEEEEEEVIEYETVVLWEFPNENQTLANGYQGEDPLTERDYHYVNVTSAYQGFSGNARFTLFVDGNEEWDLQIGDDAPAVFESRQERMDPVRDVGVAPMTIAYDYEPYGFPQDFYITIEGTYPVNRG